MAGIGAGLVTGPAAGPSLTPASSAQMFKTIAWLRWRIFLNSLRGKGAFGELFVKILSYPLLALMVFGPAVGSGFGAWYIVSQASVVYLAIPLWIIFFLWQFIGASTSATGPSFDLAALIRFPIRYRDYVLIHLSFGLMDPPTLSGLACLTAVTIGVGVAEPSLLAWTAVVMAAYALANLLFSRMVYSWLEKWLAKRKTRELVTGVILFVSLGIQVLAQYAQRLGHHGEGAPTSPWMVQTGHILLAINWVLPPGLATVAIDQMNQMHSGSALLAVGALLGVGVYAGVFLLALHLRFSAQYRGESLSEAPAASRAKAKTAGNLAARPAVVSAPPPSGVFRLMPEPVWACLVKEVRYLARSGPKLYVLVMPLFVVFLFTVKNSGLASVGLNRGAYTGFLFSYACAYMQLIFVGMLYNSLGSDGAGVQFYYLSPARFRDAMLAKNLLVIGVIGVEAVLIYAISAFVSAPASAALTCATLAWMAFTILVNISVGNVRSIVSPRAVDASKMRSQNVSGLNGLISLLVVMVCVGLGALTVFGCIYFQASYWVAALAFLVLAGLALAMYLMVLRQLDQIAEEHAEDLIRVLCKS